MITIYVLKCTNNKYYIGKTMNDISKRFNTHQKGHGAVWTRKYRPIKILESHKNCDHFDEDKYTKIYMDKYGIENVRGGSYTKINLDNSTINFLKKELSSIHDKCYGCGSKSHFIKECPKIYKNNDSTSSSDDTESTISNDTYSTDDTYSNSSCDSYNSYYNLSS